MTTATARRKPASDSPDGARNFHQHLTEGRAFFDGATKRETRVETFSTPAGEFTRYVNEYWTPRQRQAAPIHEVAYRACFKPQLPRFFIEHFTKPGELVYDPFSGRGTTVLEAGLLGRRAAANDINPLSALLSRPRFFIPDLKQLAARLEAIPLDLKIKPDRDLSMFFHKDTLREILSLREYLRKRKVSRREDALDGWIRMAATNRLTGHSSGFFSVYTLPPNQALSPESQIKINRDRKLVPPYRDVRKVILKKSAQLSSELTPAEIVNLREAGKSALFLENDARRTPKLKSGSVRLTVTSPPFLTVVQYARDNWMRCWFNDIKSEKIEKKITMEKTLPGWEKTMGEVMHELYRITARGGWVAFEVGEVQGARVRLDEHIAPLGVKAGFRCFGVLINEQEFTKTSNIWGVKNNAKGTNTNRIVVFQKK